jgi:hypothetical protein
VSCAGPTFCAAVGEQGPVTNNGLGLSLPFAEKWSGSTWTSYAVAHVAGSTTDIVFGVACESSTDCESVGYSAHRHQRTLDTAEVSSGAVWMLVPCPTPILGDTNLFAVTFPKPAVLMTVGQDAVGTNTTLEDAVVLRGP